VVGWVEWALARIPPEFGVLAVEESVRIEMPRNARSAGATLGGKIDLVLQNPDGSIEQIEFKTGGATSETLQEVICRAGVCQRFDASGDAVHSTVMQLTSEQEFPSLADRAEAAIVFREIDELIQRIWTATEWPAIENPRCHFCEYREEYCSLHLARNRPNRLDSSIDE
jgi:hypothetical protein